MNNNNWRLLIENARNNFLVLNINNFSDGQYQFKVMIKSNTHLSDSKKNIKKNSPQSKAEAIRDGYESKKYIFDNTSPLVVLKKTTNNKIWVLATDNISRIAHCRYSIDEKNYYNLIPEDGIFDNTEEKFSIDLPADYHNKILTLHISDEHNNSTYKNIDF